MPLSSAPIEKESRKIVDRLADAVAEIPTANAALLTIAEVAVWLNTSKAWVRDHATRSSPRIPVVRLGEQRALLRFRQQDIEEFITQHLSDDEKSVQ